MAETFEIRIITPDRVFYTGQADFIEFTSVEGNMGVYRNHIPMTIVLAPGPIRIHKGEELKVAALHSGFAEILGDRVTFLAEIAEWPDEIDESRALEAKERAEQRIAAKTEGTDIARAEIALRRALARIDTLHARM